MIKCHPTAYRVWQQLVKRGLDVAIRDMRDRKTEGKLVMVRDETDQFDVFGVGMRCGRHVGGRW